MDFKNKKVVLTAAVIGVLLLLGGGWYVMSAKNNASTQVANQSKYEEDEVIPTLAPEEIGLEFIAKLDKKYVKFIINKPEGIEQVDYDISYNAISNGNTVNQGLTGEVKKDEFKNGKIEINWRELGTCSTGGKCRFDEGVAEVTLILRITKKDDQVFQVTKTLTL